MDKYKFKVGDMIIGNSKNHYAFTSMGWKGIVTFVKEEYFSAKGLVPSPSSSGRIIPWENLKYEYFDLIEIDSKYIEKELDELIYLLENKKHDSKI